MRSSQSAKGRSFSSIWHAVELRLSAYAGSALAGLVPRIRSAVAGHDPNAASRHAAIYVAYDRWSLLPDYVVGQVAALSAAGRRITFISHSPLLPPACVARLGPHVREIVHRRNFGHDFGGYKDGIARLGDVGSLDSLVLMNDSCYGPFSSLEAVDGKAAQSGAGIYGITDSWDMRYHLQTYYLWIGAAVLRSGAFAKFWRGLLPSQPRSLVILNGEVGFTQAMLKAGFCARALCPYEDAARHAQTAARRSLAEPAQLLAEERRYLRHLAHAILAGHTLNPTHAFWDILVTHCGAPFIKRELLRRNPIRVPGLLGWERVVAGLPPAELEAIRSHLQRG